MLEEQLKISEKDKFKISSQLISDATFLESCGWIDYSLFLVKINWGMYCITHNCAVDAIKDRFVQGIQMVSITDEQECYYHLGIIDYFQEWNSKKQLEKISKQIKHIQPNLDTSAQDPKKYRERFVEQVCKNYIFGQQK